MSPFRRASALNRTSWSWTYWFSKPSSRLSKVVIYGPHGLASWKHHLLVRMWFCLDLEQRERTSQPRKCVALWNGANCGAYRLEPADFTAGKPDRCGCAWGVNQVGCRT